jgi:hypothetical protein
MSSGSESELATLFGLGLRVQHPDHRWARQTFTIEPPSGSSRPILQLSADMLSHIFFLCRDEIRAESDFRDGDQVVDLFDWVQVSAVCRAWRQTALETQGLWSRIELDRPRSVGPMLLPSGSASLSIVSREVDRRSYYTSETWSMILAHMSRVRELDLVLVNLDAMYLVLTGLATTGAPCLEKIVIRFGLVLIDQRAFAQPPSKARLFRLHPTQGLNLKVLSLEDLN